MVMLMLVMKAAAARRALQVLQEHRLWARVAQPESALVLTQPGWEADAPYGASWGPL